ncbi:TPA: hypothetical protein I8273_004546 [Aeromonas hydrophila]|nr:hypothetical protein [Aeromonas hydrophila]HAT2639009.1 hypothetical protein [Aeromonas hydrophila]HAT3424131.1 hypothetical protein [Aeromonas hydrophila]HAT3534170.1 hypothetical protein [Aeromonas hydrophila]
MEQQVLLDTDGKPLVIGMMYCCVTYMVEDEPSYGALVRYCGKDPDSGRAMFADADTWDECSIDADALLSQNSPVINPATQGWPTLAE